MTLKKEVLSEYINPVFVETGSAFGDGIQTALEVGFRDIYSCEPDEELYKICVNRFEESENVHLYNLTSVEFLKQYLTLNNDGPSITFWLDGHINSKLDTVYGEGCPVLKDLEIIACMAGEGHIILIDDIRIFKQKKSKWNNIGLDDVLKQLKKYEYEFIRYEDGYKKNDILVARI